VLVRVALEQEHAQGQAVVAEVAVVIGSTIVESPCHVYAAPIAASRLRRRRQHHTPPTGALGFGAPVPLTIDDPTLVAACRSLGIRRATRER
jgi:hypothetical protein